MRFPTSANTVACVGPRLTPAALALALTAALYGSPARAEIACSIQKDFFVWECLYSARDAAWVWHKVLVGDEERTCDNHLFTNGQVTLCYDYSADPCGGECPPGDDQCQLQVSCLNVPGT